VIAEISEMNICGGAICFMGFFCSIKPPKVNGFSVDGYFCSPMPSCVAFYDTFKS